MLNYRNVWNGQGKNNALCFISIMPINLDELSRKNLIRIMQERDLKQVALAEKIGTTPQHLNAIVRGDRGLGPDLMARIIRELSIEPWEFYWTEKTPIVKDQHEQHCLDLFRRAETMGVAEDVERYGEYRIGEAKKNARLGGKSAQGGVPRRGRKAG